MMDKLKAIIFGPQHVDTVENVIKGISYGEDVSLPLDWSCSHFKYDKHGCQINGFVFLDNVARQFSETQDSRLMSVIVAYVMDWVKKNTSYVPNTWAWYDDAIARRVQRMSYYYAKFSDFFSRRELNELRVSLDMQAHVLMNDSYYRFGHNHGMFMDLALICYALLVCDDPEFKEKCFDKACGRMQAYFQYIFTDDGVHKEHSPGYAREISNVAATVSRVMMNVRPRFAASICNYGECALKWLTALTRPDGRLPSIGDSHYLSNNVLPSENVVFPSGGYAVFRSSWYDRPDIATWVLFMAATHGNTHKHSDDLSFLLWHGGDFIVEAGYRNYNYIDPDTAYTYSGYGHNVLCVEDKDFPVKISSNGFRSVLPDALKTRIINYDLDGAVKSVTGRQGRFSNVVQERTLRYDKANNVVEVDDVLVAKEELKATLIFHIAPGVSVRQDGRSVFFVRSNRPLASMSFSSDNDLSVRVLRADESLPPYRTAVFINNLTMKDGSLVLIDFKCRKGRSVTKTRITLEPLTHRDEQRDTEAPLVSYDMLTNSNALKVSGMLMADNEEPNPKAAVLLVQFIDIQGRTVSSGDLVFSQRFSSDYVYVPSGEVVSKVIKVPKGAIRVKLNVVRFLAKRRIQIDWFRVDVND